MLHIYLDSSIAVSMQGTSVLTSEHAFEPAIPLDVLSVGSASSVIAVAMEITSSGLEINWKHANKITVKAPEIEIMVERYMAFKSQ